MAAAISFWLAVLLLILRARGGSLAGAIVCLLISSGCVWAAWKLENGIAGKGAAIVVTEDAEARVATADTARSMLGVVCRKRSGDFAATRRLGLRDVAEQSARLDRNKGG